MHRGPFVIIGGIPGHGRFTVHDAADDGDWPWISTGPVFVCECGAGFASRAILNRHADVRRQMEQE